MPPATQLPLPLPAPQPGAEGGDSLPDRLCALLARRGRPLEVGHVASQLLRLRRCPERLQRRLVAEIVEGDARLAWLGRDLVGLAPRAWSRGRARRRPTFCVVDLETTGGSPGYSKVTEIGAVRVEGGQVGERFATLVDPGRPIPPVVTELTGIDDAMVAGSPDIEAALARLRRLRRPGRAGGPQRALRPALPQLRAPPPGRPLLHPAVARHAGAGAAAAERAGAAPRPRHAGGLGRHLACARCHRALPDAEATAEVLVALLEPARRARRSTPWSGRSRSPGPAARATPTSSRWPRTSRARRAST